MDQVEMSDVSDTNLQHSFQHFQLKSLHDVHFLDPFQHWFVYENTRKELQDKMKGMKLSHSQELEGMHSNSDDRQETLKKKIKTLQEEMDEMLTEHTNKINSKITDPERSLDSPEAITTSLLLIASSPVFINTF